MRNVASIATAILLIWGCSRAMADNPPLPEGLGDPSSEAPALPPGLAPADAPSTGPALPPGLDSPAQDSGPALPPGLDDVSANESTPGEEAPRLRDRLPDWIYGFWETRAGPRVQDDPAQSKAFTIAETRLQLKVEKFWEKAAFEYTGDFILDGVMEEADYDLRQLRLTLRITDSMDLRIGRQVLTWGTGDLLFINDLFPKDWQSFFIGRDEEYLKAPSDSLRLGWYNDWVNMELVYTPQFTPDRYISGERISYWNPMSGFAGSRNQVDTNPPSDWFQDDEIAVRFYRNIGSYEVALYGYWGYWKSPAGQKLFPMQAAFPRLDVYGASVRGPVGKGIGNIEIGYYDSRDDQNGSNPFVNNSELRLLIGYEQELAKNLTGGFQYYVEHMLDYDNYRKRLFIGEPRDETRHVVTARITKLLMNQNLTLSLFAYYSPTDNDAYLRPKVNYKIDDHWSVEAGGNWFIGEKDYTFFGQFENNSNIYVAFRFAF